jgi:anti-sigma factor RsiW
MVMNPEHETLLRYLEGSLPEDETAGIRSRIGHEPDLARRVERLRRLQAAARATAADSFAPYFSDRVMKRLRGTAEIPAEAGVLAPMGQMFARLAFAALLIAGSLGAYNVIEYQRLGLSNSIVETMFGLPQADIIEAIAYDLDAYPSEY